MKKKTPAPKVRRARPAAPTPTAPAARPSYADLVRIVEVLRSTERFSEFRLKAGDIEIEVKRSRGAPGAAPAPQAPVPSAPVAEAPAPAAMPAAPQPGIDPASLPDGLELVRSPTMGTFYRSPKPGAPPFVEPGTRVAKGDTLALVEVMKLFNAVNAPCAGTVTHVLAGDAVVVAEGQPLVAIRPA